MNGREAAYRELARVSPGGARVYIAFSVKAGPHGDHIRMNTQYVCHNLRRGGLVPLTLRAGTYSNYDLAIDIQFAIGALRITRERRLRIDDLRLAEIIGPGVEGGADSNANEPPLLTGGRLFFLPLAPTYAL